MRIVNGLPYRRLHAEMKRGQYLAISAAWTGAGSHGPFGSTARSFSPISRAYERLLVDFADR